MRESKPLVLVADDEPPMNDLVAEHLRSLQPKVDILQAHDGAEAWQLAKEHLPDLVVLDVMMPEMSGWEVCRKIREDVALAHTGVVMLTGIGETLNSLTSPLYGADAYLDKPFTPDDLHNAVRAVLDARAAQRNAAPRPSTHGLLEQALAEDARTDRPQKPVAKKAAPKKTAAKKPAPKKPAPKKAAPKKAVATKKAAPKKTVAKKAAPKKTAAKKPAPKKAVATKKAAPKKTVAKKAAPKKTVAKKPAPKKVATKKAAPKKTVAKKAAPKKAVAKKVAPKKVVAKKTVAKKPNKKR